MSARHFVADGLIFEVRDVSVADLVWLADAVINASIGAAPLAGAAVTGQICVDTTRLPAILVTSTELAQRMTAVLPSSRSVPGFQAAASVLGPLLALRSPACTARHHHVP